MSEPTDVSRSFRVFPGGSNGEFNLPRSHSMVIRSGKGCRLTDTSGRTYLDMSMGWGSALVGHAREEIVEAVSRQVGWGGNFAYVTEPSLRVADEIVRLSPACEQVRYCASGTEATMYCIRLARAATGREKVLKFEGAYHGANDIGVTSLFPSGTSTFPNPEATSAGVESSSTSNVLIAPFNDADKVTEIVNAHGPSLAAVIVEPLHRCLPPEPGFLTLLRSLTQSHGIPLIFDEVVTGFRLAYGGAQEYYGVVPDLVAYGKALGGGLPIGMYGGSRRFMEVVEEHRLGSSTYVWTASTLGGNPVSTAAAAATLGILSQPGVHTQLHDLGAYTRSGMETVLTEIGIAGRVIGDGPLAQVVFLDEEGPITDYRMVKRGNGEASRHLMLDLFASGIFLNPMGTKLYLSLAHSKEDIDEFLSHFGASLLRTVEAHPGISNR